MRGMLPAALLLFVYALFSLKTNAQTGSAAVDCKAQRLSGAEQDEIGHGRSLRVGREGGLAGLST